MTHVTREALLEQFPAITVEDIGRNENVFSCHFHCGERQASVFVYFGDWFDNGISEPDVWISNNDEHWKDDMDRDTLREFVELETVVKAIRWIIDMETSQSTTP